MTDGAIVIKAKIDSGELDKGLTEVEGKVTKSANNLSGILKGAGIAGLIAGATKLAVQTAKEINEQTEKVMTKLKGASTLYQGVAVNQERLVASLSAIATETGESLENLGQSVYDALSAGIRPTEDMADVLKVVSASAKLAKGGFTDVSTALSASLKVVNAYGMGIDELDKVQGILMQTQNRGITTVNELGEALAQVVPTASAFGVPFEQVGSALAEMTKQGTKTRVATTQLNAIIAELGKSGTTASKNLKASAESAGLADTDFRSLLDSGMNLAEILDLMDGYAKANGESMVDMFSSIEAGKASLQLTGKNLDGFNEDMKAMADSSGLVQEAFEKTVDPSERLSSAWSALAVSLGTKFKPTADAVRTAVADTVTQMAGQIASSRNLTTATQTLTTASENYRKAQEDAKGATDLTTLSMKEQARAEYLRGIANMVEEYDKAEERITELRKKQADYSSQIATNEDYQQTEYSMWGDATKDFEEFIALIAEGSKEVPSGIATQVKYYEGVINHYKKLNAEAEGEVVGLQAEMQTSIRSLAMAVKEGILDISDISLWSVALADEVTATIPVLEEETRLMEESASAQGENTEKTIETVGVMKEFTDKVEELNEKYKNLDNAQKENGASLYEMSDKLEEMTSLYIEFVEKGLDPASEEAKKFWEEISNLDGKVNPTISLYGEFTDELAELKKGYKALKDSGTEVGTSLYSQSKYLSDLEAIYEKFLKKGLSPTAYGMTFLADEIERLRKAESKQKTLAEQLTDTYSKTALEYEYLANAGTLLGESLYSQEDELSDLTRMYESFIRQGLDPADDSMVNLKKRIEELNASLGDGGAVNGYAEEWRAFMRNTAGSFADDIARGAGDSLASWMYATFSPDKAFKEINDEIKRLEKDLEDSNGEIAIAEAELMEARARGDEAEIRRAEEKIRRQREINEGLRESIREQKNLKKATENGTTAWKAFAKASLLALASVLEGLGHQLTAMAISTYPNVGQMIASGAGAVGAYTASALLKNYAGQFEEGGIVGGNSYTGDHMIARVNSGELIMNTAQQDSLARVLDSASSLASMGAGGIVVNMGGAYIYGLDSEEVGRAIYENIENLKHEGVI